MEKLRTKAWKLELFEEQRQMLTSKKNFKNPKIQVFFSHDAIKNVIAEYNCMPEEVIFSSYFRRYENLYKTDCSNLPGHKLGLVLRKLGTVEHTKFVNYILSLEKKVT